MAKRFFMKPQGTSFATRLKATEVADELRDEYEGGEVTIDFTGVRVISPSFAAKFVEELRRWQRDSDVASVAIVADSALVRERLIHANKRLSSFGQPKYGEEVLVQ